MYAFSSDDLIKIIYHTIVRVAGENEIWGRSLENWCKRDWICAETTSKEQFLSRFPALNPFTAQVT